MTVFKSSGSSPKNRQGNGSTTTTAENKTRPNPKIKVTKPPTSSNQNPKKLQLYSFFSSDSPSSSSSSSSSASPNSEQSSSLVYYYFTSVTNMLFPSTPLFNSVTGAESPSKTGAKSPKLRHSLFNRSKKQQQQQHKQESLSSSGWSSSGQWPGWIGDTTTESSSKKDTNTSSSKIWMLKSSNKSGKSDTEATSSSSPPQHHSRENFFKKKKRTLDVNFSQDQKSTTSDNENSGADGQIMLRPYYNLSNPSVISLNNNTMYPSSTTSPSPNDQSWIVPQPYQQQQHYSLQEQSSYFYQNQHLQQSQQQLHHPSRRGVTLAVHDVFGLGKVIEMMLALFVAHDAFLFRRPIWMQCAVMIWEAAVVLLIIWGILRVVGLAEVVVWGADDLVRGTFSTVKMFGNTVRMLIWR